MSYISVLTATALMMAQTVNNIGVQCAKHGMSDYLALQALIVRHQSGELASLVQTGSQQTWDLLDHCLTGQESAVLLSCIEHTNNQFAIRLGLLLGTEAPVMAPNSIDFSFLVLSLPSDNISVT